MKNKDKMHIALACDINYLLHTMAVIKQIDEYDHDNVSEYFVFVPNDANFSSMQKTFTKMAAALDINIRVHAQSSGMFAAKRKHLTESTFSRLFMSRVVYKQGIHKLLYLDSDILVLKSLLPIWKYCNVNKKKPLAMAFDAPYLYRHDVAQTYNAGVLCMHTKTLTKQDIVAKALWLARFIDLEQEDQTILNIFGTMINGIMLMPNSFNDQRMSVYTNGEKLSELTIIKHFVGELKPWNYKENMKLITSNSILDKFMQYEKSIKKYVVE